MALCEVPGCINRALYFKENLETLCENHISDIHVYKYKEISMLSEEEVKDLIPKKISKITHSISEKHKSSMKDQSIPRLQKKKIDSWKKKITEHLQRLTSNYLNFSLEKLYVLLVRLNYFKPDYILNLDLNTEKNLKIDWLKSKFQNEDFIDIDYLSIDSMLKCVYNLNFSIEKWTILKRNKRIIMKVCRSEDIQSHANFFIKELNFLESQINTTCFIKVIDKQERGELISYFTEFIDNDFGKLIGTIRFRTAEIINYLKFCVEVYERMKGYIDFYYFEPSLIGYENNNFVLLDFKYNFEAVDKKYLNVEYISREGCEEQRVLYSAAVILLEMLGCNISGTTVRGCKYTVRKMIDDLEMKVEIKSILKEILCPPRENRPTCNEIISRIQGL